MTLLILLLVPWLILSPHPPPLQLSPCIPYDRELLTPMKESILTSAPHEVSLRFEAVNPRCGVPPELKVVAQMESSTYQRIAEVIEWAEDIDHHRQGFWSISFQLETSVRGLPVTIDEADPQVWQEAEPLLQLGANWAQALRLHSQQRSATLEVSQLDSADDIRAVADRVARHPYPSHLSTCFTGPKSTSRWTLCPDSRPELLADLADYSSAHLAGHDYNGHFWGDSGQLVLTFAGTSPEPEKLKATWPHGHVAIRGK